jgi:bifunctional non-homologous end joining protein LigD
VNRGSQKGILVYYVFDLLFLDNKDLRQMPLSKRKQWLERLLKNERRILYLDHVEGVGLALFQGAVKLGQEGIVAKDGKSPYVEGPRLTWHWQKIKNKEYKRQGKVEFRQSRGKG